jgi:hypothetical protein
MRVGGKLMGLLGALVVAVCTYSTAGCGEARSPDAGRVAGSPSLPVPPPAVSGINRTVVIRWQLADSFDVTGDGSCAGRSVFRGMAAGARAHLTGASTGLLDETRVTAHVERRAPNRGDDGLYCVIEAVFAPAVPDPDGYSLKFFGSEQREVDLGPPGSTPLGHTGFNRPDLPPGYGFYNWGSQSCPSLLDPPSKDYPELAP